MADAVAAVAGVSTSGRAEAPVHAESGLRGAAHREGRPLPGRTREAGHRVPRHEGPLMKRVHDTYFQKITVRYQLHGQLLNVLEAETGFHLTCITVYSDTRTTPQPGKSDRNSARCSALPNFRCSFAMIRRGSLTPSRPLLYNRIPARNKRGHGR